MSIFWSRWAIAENSLNISYILCPTDYHSLPHSTATRLKDTHIPPLELQCDYWAIPFRPCEWECFFRWVTKSSVVDRFELIDMAFVTTTLTQVIDVSQTYWMTCRAKGGTDSSHHRNAMVRSQNNLTEIRGMKRGSDKNHGHWMFDRRNNSPAVKKVQISLTQQ
jgi:hypothetical protein